MRTNTSVVICIRNVEKYIGKCISSLLDQTFKDFEIVIVDDGCSDNTRRLVQKFKDKRVRYYENKESIGIAKSRNKGLQLSRGEYIFFTDGDCIASKDWLEQGLKSLENENCVGVEGRIYYVSKEYKPTYSNHVCKNEFGGHFMTGNVAYKRSVIESVGGFDERYDYFEDRDLALRILKRGKIGFNPNMIVFVQHQTVTPKDLMRSADYIKNRVYLFKRFGERKLMFWRIVDPLNLAKALFPPLILVSLFFNRFKTLDDFKLLPFTYVYAILERPQLWKTCAKERVFLV